MQKCMNSSDILLSLEGENLKVFKDMGGKVCVCYENAEIKDGSFLLGTVGKGENFESACDDYLSQIRGKKIIFDSCFANRREVTVLG